MTGATTKPERSIVEIIRESRRPEGEMQTLSARAARLHEAMRVAERWIDATMEVGGAVEMCERASAIHDEIEEELARATFKAEELVRRREYEAAGREVSEDVVTSGLLSDALREIYCALSSAPLEIFSILESETSPRTRYMLMGALLAAQDAAEREIERAAPKS